MKTPEDEEFDRMAKMQEWKTNELHKCTACSTQYSEDEGGIEGNFGILPMNFCPTCLSCMLDMAEQLNFKEWVGLTDEEIKAFDTWHDNREEEVGWCNPSEIVAYIEALLKEKNNEK